MKQINPKSASALVWFAAILIVAGWLVMSPSGAFALFVLAALFAVFPAVFGSRGTRIAAAVLLLVSIIFASIKYPEFKSEREMISKRTKNSSMK